jgi:uncharacterized membrane protein
MNQDNNTDNNIYNIFSANTKNKNILLINKTPTVFANSPNIIVIMILLLIFLLIFIFNWQNKSQNLSNDKLQNNIDIK